MTQHNNNIIKELEEISPLLAGIPRTPVHYLPPDYFNSLANHIILNIRKNEALSGVPEGYFDNLAGEILMKIRAEEGACPLLDAISKENPHFVPAGYFNSLPENLLEKTKKPQTRVVSISFFARYAAASVITGILGLGLFSRLSNSQDNQDMTPILANAESILKSGSFEKELNSLDEQDITEYLETRGHDVEAALLASAAESHDLPDAIDYILQENTLARFMDNLNIAD